MTDGRLDDITAACEEAKSISDSKTLLIIHARTNDIINNRSVDCCKSTGG